MKTCLSARGPCMEARTLRAQRPAITSFTLVDLALSAVREFACAIGTLIQLCGSGGEAVPSLAHQKLRHGLATTFADRTRWADLAHTVGIFETARRAQRALLCLLLRRPSLRTAHARRFPLCVGESSRGTGKAFRRTLRRAEASKCTIRARTRPRFRGEFPRFTGDAGCRCGCCADATRLALRAPRATHPGAERARRALGARS